MFEMLADPTIWASLLTLTAMEIVLGIDNVVFISVIASRLPPATQMSARAIGLGLALIFRIVLLFTLTYLLHLTEPLFTITDFGIIKGYSVSWREIILLGGGLFLLVKGTLEIHAQIEGGHGKEARKEYASFIGVIAQIIIIDVVFSVDSIITAIGMTPHISIMIAAVVFAVAVMFVASGPATEFIRRHPTTKMLALSFLILIGVFLVADGMGLHIPRGYIYFAMGFAALVEVLNVLARRRRRREA